MLKTRKVRKGYTITVAKCSLDIQLQQLKMRTLGKTLNTFRFKIINPKQFESLSCLCFI